MLRMISGARLFVGFFGKSFPISILVKKTLQSHRKASKLCHLPVLATFVHEPRATYPHDSTAFEHAATLNHRTSFPLKQVVVPILELR